MLSLDILSNYSNGSNRAAKPQLDLQRMTVNNGEHSNQYVTSSQLAERFPRETRHTRHCQSCSEALRVSQQLQQFGELLVILGLLGLQDGVSVETLNELTVVKSRGIMR